MAGIDKARLLRTGGPPLFVFMWSAGFIFLRIGLDDADPLTLLAMRYALVEMVLLPVALVIRPALPCGRQWLHLAMVGFLVQAVHFGGLNLSLEFGLSPGASALFTGLQPILVALLAPWLAGERVSARRWIGLALGLLGAAVVILSRSSVANLPVWGIVSAAVALLTLTAGTLYERRFGVRQHPVTASIVQCGVGLLVALPLAAVFEPMHVRLTGGLAVSLTYLVLGNSIVSLTLLMAMIRLGEASRVSALFFLVPPTTALLAWLALGQSLTLAGWGGLAVSAVGVAIVTLERRTANTA